MPHGGGHAGGGHFSGGGGFHHHHHHHGFRHHHHHHHGGGYVVLGPTYYYRRRRGGLIFLGLFAVLAVVAVFVASGFGIHNNYFVADDDHFSPGDNRLTSFSTFFCTGGQINIETFGYSATLYLIGNKKPPLVPTNSFYINETINSLLHNEYNYWYFYLYKGSKISITACSQITSDYSIYIVKGRNNYKTWVSHTSTHYERKVLISQSCDRHAPYTYTVSNEDTYYVVIISKSFDSGTANLFMRYDRTGYSVVGLNNQSVNCTTSTIFNPCTVTVPFNSDYHYALLTTTTPLDDNNWDDNLDVDYYCITYIPGYLVVILVPFIVVASGCACLAIGIAFCVLQRKKKNSSTEPLLSSASSASSIHKEQSNTFSEQPPPYNPAQPPVGSAPPPYQM